METLTTTYLQMGSPDELIPKPCPDPRFSAVPVTNRSWKFHRFLYSYVGEDWLWKDRLVWSPEDWIGWLERDDLTVVVGYLGGTPAGFYELLKRNQEVQIVYFGLEGSFLGLGLGGYFLTHAVRTAWQLASDRVWLHTCTRDHPHALSNYLHRGFQIYRTETTQC